MSKTNALFPQVKNDIAFDTLWPQVTDAITRLSGTVWTDTADHDPGITLLQAVTWNCSDLSYRSSHSLNDLLTMEGVATLFPPTFGPDNVLTCTTVTPDDYRRAVLDLHSNDTDIDAPSQGFFYRDARLVEGYDSAALKWWYNKESREYTFSEPAEVSADNKVKLSLRGNNRLYIVPTRFYNSLSAANKRLANQLRDDFLENHRNLGENTNYIANMKAANFQPELTIELFEDVRDINLTVAQIFMAMEALIMPPPVRQTTAQRQSAGESNEDIFEGPRLNHGWQQASESSIDADGNITLNLSQLFNRLLEIDDINSVSAFSSGILPGEITPVAGDAWSWNVEHYYYPLLWGSQPLEMLATVDNPYLKLIAKGGIRQYPDPEIVTKYLAESDPIQTGPVTLAAGTHRNLSAYTPVGDRLPACYQLQQPNEVTDDGVRELHQFLLTVDQQLADGCAELAALPQLLGFTDRGDLNAIRGTRWPLAPDAVGQQVHEEYATTLTAYQQRDAAVRPATYDANYVRELDFINYLLGYFGTARAARPLTLDIADFLATQRAFLEQQPALGYDRTNIRIDKVSALQKRIAARIGLNSECFAEDADLGKLPFYIIEHRQLLPLMPDDSWKDEQTPTDFISHTKPIVTITQAGSAGKILQGQLIDLIAIEGNSKLYVKQQLVTSTSGDSFTVNTANSLQLQNDLDRLQDAWNGTNKGNLRWQNSNTWLQDMDFRLNYGAAMSTDTPPLASNQRWLTSSDQTPFPTMVSVGDKIIIHHAGLQFSMTGLQQPVSKADGLTEEEWQLEATILEVDVKNWRLRIEKAEGSTQEFPAGDESWRYQWNFSEAAYASADRFSFVISIVHKSSMFAGADIDAALLLNWMQETIMAEFPAHVSIINLWLSDSAFANFSATYKRWQNNGSPLGDDAFAIMQMLTLGHLPVSQLGIGLMRVATEAQQVEVLGEDGTGWDTSVILDQELFYVPQDLPSA